MSFPTITIPGLGEMTYTTAAAIRAGDFQTAYLEMQQMATEYGEMHPQLATAFKTAAIAGGVFALATWAPVVGNTLLAAERTLEGASLVDLAGMAPQTLGLTPALGSAFGAATLVGGLSRLDLGSKGYSGANFVQYEAQRNRWSRLEQAELEYRWRNPHGSDSEVDVVYFDPENPFSLAESTGKEALKRSHVPYNPSKRIPFTGYTVEGESQYWVNHFQYGKEDGHEPENEVGTDQQDLEYEGVKSQVACEAEGNEAFLQDVYDQTIEFMLSRRGEPVNANTVAKLETSHNFDQQLEIAQRELFGSELRDLIQDAECARMGLTARYDEYGNFTGYDGLPERVRRPFAPNSEATLYN